MDTAVELEDQPFDADSVGDSEDADLVPLQSGEDWVAQLDDDLSGPATRTGEAFRISALQRSTFAVTRTKTGQRITVSGVSRFVVWWSFGTEPHTGPVEFGRECPTM